MQITVTRQKSDTAGESWEFYFSSEWGSNGKFILDSYAKKTRKSTHHAAKWDSDYFNGYDRLRHRDGLKVEEVPLPESVKQEAKKLLLEKIAKIQVTVQI